MLICNSGCETNKCQITTWNDSDIGVINFLFSEFTNIQISEFLNAYPSFFPTIDIILLFFVLANFIALIKLIEIFFLHFLRLLKRLKLHHFFLDLQFLDIQKK